MVHIDARDEKTCLPTFKPEVDAKIIGGIRPSSMDLIICVSLSGRGITEFEHLSAPLKLDVDVMLEMGNLTMSSLILNKTVSRTLRK